MESLTSASAAICYARLREEQTKARAEACWREMDSNFQYAGAVNLG
jgi:hypothetical protein